jgi:hypothetical protein
VSRKRLFSAALVIPCLMGCQRVDEPIVGRYRAVLDLPGGEAPFGLDVAQEDCRYVLYLLNGTERTRVSNMPKTASSRPLSPEFDQEHDRVTGTVMTPAGDHRYLDGQINDDELQLSAFAGGPAYLYKLRVTSSGELEGDHWEGMKRHERVAAKRDPDAELEARCASSTADSNDPQSAGTTMNPSASFESSSPC